MHFSTPIAKAPLAPPPEITSAVFEFLAWATPFFYLALCHFVKSIQFANILSPVAPVNH